MILGGDEFARSQRGNNNAYCQDNPRSTVVLLAQRPGFARRSGVIELSEQHAVDPAG
jgi:isoamylase